MVIKGAECRCASARVNILGVLGNLGRAERVREADTGDEDGDLEVQNVGMK